MASNNDIEKDTFADNPELEARFNLAAQGLAETYGLPQKTGKPDFAF